MQNNYFIIKAKSKQRLPFYDVLCLLKKGLYAFLYFYQTKHNNNKQQR